MELCKVAITIAWTFLLGIVGLLICYFQDLSRRGSDDNEAKPRRRVTNQQSRSNRNKTQPVTTEELLQAESITEEKKAELPIYSDAPRSSSFQHFSKSIEDVVKRLESKSNVESNHVAPHKPPAEVHHIIESHKVENTIGKLARDLSLGRPSPERDEERDSSQPKKIVTGKKDVHVSDLVKKKKVPTATLR